LDGALKNRLSIFNEKVPDLRNGVKLSQEQVPKLEDFLRFRKPKKTVDKERWKSRIATEPQAYF